MGLSASPGLAQSRPPRLLGTGKEETGCGCCAPPHGFPGSPPPRASPPTRDPGASLSPGVARARGSWPCPPAALGGPGCRRPRAPRSGARFQEAERAHPAEFPTARPGRGRAQLRTETPPRRVYTSDRWAGRRRRALRSPAAGPLQELCEWAGIDSCPGPCPRPPPAVFTTGPCSQALPLAKTLPRSTHSSHFLEI